MNYPLFRSAWSLDEILLAIQTSDIKLTSWKQAKNLDQYFALREYLLWFRKQVFILCLLLDLRLHCGPQAAWEAVVQAFCCCCCKFTKSFFLPSSISFDKCDLKIAIVVTSFTCWIFLSCSELRMLQVFVQYCLLYCELLRIWLSISL